MADKLTVNDFHAAALKAYDRQGHIKFQRSPGPDGAVRLEVGGASRFGRFQSKIGARWDRHIAVTHAFGQAIRREFGEDFFKRLPAKVRNTLNDGYRGVTIKNSRHHINAIYRDHIAPHLKKLNDTARSNQEVLQLFLDNELSNSKQSVIDNLAIRTTLADGQSIDGPGFDAIVSDALKRHLAAQLEVDPRREKIEPLNREQIAEAIKELMPELVAKHLSLSTMAKLPRRSLADAQRSQEGAFALSDLKNRSGAADVPRFNRQYSEADIGTAFGEKYRISGAKERGVEPGFVATKQWTESDTVKMLDLGPDNPNRRYTEVSSKAYLALQTGDRFRELLSQCHSGEARALLARLNDPAAPEMENLTSDQRLERVRVIVQDDESLRTQMAGPDFQALLVRVNQRTTTEQDKLLIELLRSAIVPQTLKFTKPHYLKLDYHDRTVTGKLTGKYARGKRQNVSGLKLATDRVVRWWKSGTPRDLNAAAVKEALANDLTRALGVPTQKLKLVESRFDNGQVKWMLDGTHVTGSSEEEKYSDLTKFMSGHGTRQVLVKEPYDEARRKAQQNGPIVLEADTSRRGMGRYKAVFTLLADVDAVGSVGQNKGTVGNEFFAIDPGHSLDDRSMQGDIPRNDFAIEEGYKNFSIFDQSPFSERMRGLKDTLDAVGNNGVQNIFEEYRSEFGGNTNPESQFTPEIDGWQQSLDARANRFREGFADRLAVYNFELPATDAAHQSAQHDKILDTLDTLEKITSEHQWTQRWTNAEGQPVMLKLAYPEVNFKQRQAWRVTEHDHSIVFEMETANASARRRFADFCGEPSRLPEGFKTSVVDGRIRLEIPKTDIGVAYGLFNIQALRLHEGVDDPDRLAGGDA